MAASLKKPNYESYPEIEGYMEADHIQCPNSGFEIEVGEALTSKIADDVEIRIKADVAKGRHKMCPYESSTMRRIIRHA